MIKYAKWIGYEFASDIEYNQQYCSGYLLDVKENIMAEKSMHNFLYVVEIRIMGREVAEIKEYCYKDFKEHFYDKTVLPK